MPSDFYKLNPSNNYGFVTVLLRTEEDVFLLVL